MLSAKRSTFNVQLSCDRDALHTILGLSRLTLALGFFVRSCIRNCILELEESTEEKKGKNGENI